MEKLNIILPMEPLLELQKPVRQILFCAPKNVRRFYFKLEVMVAPGLNSGIQFRSNSIKEYRNGRVHGYQSELDTSKGLGPVVSMTKREEDGFIH